MLFLLHIAHNDHIHQHELYCLPLKHKRHPFGLSGRFRGPECTRRQSRGPTKALSSTRRPTKVKDDEQGSFEAVGGIRSRGAGRLEARARNETHREEQELRRSHEDPPAVARVQVPFREDRSLLRCIFWGCSHSFLAFSFCFGFDLYDSRRNSSSFFFCTCRSF